ncbi:FAD-binding oxidoreductase [Tardiphaga sp.]|uniref:FAD-binding oxidoreductase n=1 Tax=Tardiphaga sp. TaxID=1926292 RepID=UPI002637FBB0|nr:FAD-binding oxidoreductase [Tardiphaga sp.]
MTDKDFLQQVAAIVGPNNILTDPAEMAPYLQDWRGRYTGSASCVVRPGNTEEVSGVLVLCIANDHPVVPQAGNTGLCGGAIASKSGDSVVINVSRMNGIREIDAVNGTMTVDAGCILQHVRDAADRQNLLFPMLLGSVGSCEVGGLVSTNAGGTGVLRYGNMRELVLGLEVVLPDGRIWNGLRALRKDNTGYDLKQLFIGAEGTLGIVTAAVLKLFPRVSASVSAMVALDSVSDAITLLQELRARLGNRVEAFEIMSAPQLAIVLKHMTQLRNPIAGNAPYYALIEIADSHSQQDLVMALEDVLGTALERGTIADATIAPDLAKATAIWDLRHNISESNKREGFTVSNDTSVPISRQSDFVARVHEKAKAAFPEAHVCFCGHIGDGNIHAIIVFPRSLYNSPEEFEAAASRANTIVHDASVALGGSISAEHGIGQMHLHRLPRYAAPVELDLMRTIKRALDPKWLMNPGKVITPD